MGAPYWAARAADGRAGSYFELPRPLWHFEQRRRGVGTCGVDGGDELWGFAAQATRGRCHLIATSCLPNCMPLGACDQSRLEWACAPQWRARALGRAFRGSRGVSHDGMCVSDLRVFLDVGAIATVPTTANHDASPRRRRDPVPERGAHVPFCLWCVCGAATLISVIFSHVHRRWRMVVFSTYHDRAHRFAIRADRRFISRRLNRSASSIEIHIDRSWVAHGARMRCGAGVRAFVDRAWHSVWNQGMKIGYKSRYKSLPCPLG